MDKKEEKLTETEKKILTILEHAIETKDDEIIYCIIDILSDKARFIQKYNEIIKRIDK